MKTPRWNKKQNKTFLVSISIVKSQDFGNKMLQI